VRRDETVTKLVPTKGGGGSGGRRQKKSPKEKLDGLSRWQDPLVLEKKNRGDMVRNSRNLKLGGEKGGIEGKGLEKRPRGKKKLI